MAQSIQRGFGGPPQREPEPHARRNATRREIVRVRQMLAAAPELAAVELITCPQCDAIRGVPCTGSTTHSARVAQLKGGVIE